MTQEIIEMARDSGMELYGLGKDRARFVHHLEAFAKLVAEKALAEHAMREVQRLGQEIEQEPVAFASHGVINWIADKQFQHEADLYITPPQRTQPNDIDLFWRAATTPEKWVGLTAEEVLQCWERAHEPGNDGLINAIRMADEVEQALKEKNT